MKRLRASWVVPVDAPPIRNGVVGIEAGRVAFVGPAGIPPRRQPPGGGLGAEELSRRSPQGPGDGIHSRRQPPDDLGCGVLLPGLVNAHTHLELSHLAGAVPPSPFVAWVRALIAARMGETREQVRAAARLAIDAACASGTVAIGDVSNGLQHLADLAASRLRAVVFHELVGWDPERAESTLAWAKAQLAALPGGLATGGVEVRTAAHAPYSVSPRLLSLLAAAGGPAAIHLAESAAETRFLADGGGLLAAFLAERGLGHVPFAGTGRSPVAHAEGCGILHAGLVAAHCVQTGASDHSVLAARGVHVALCPRSNLALGNGSPPLPALLAAGVRVCLGTDSLASTPDLELLREAALLRREFPDVPAAAIVRAATLGGAQALRLADHGRIAPGARAAFAFVAADVDPVDPYAHVLSGAAATGLFFD